MLWLRFLYYSIQLKIAHCLKIFKVNDNSVAESTNNSVTNRGKSVA